MTLPNSSTRPALRLVAPLSPAVTSENSDTVCQEPPDQRVQKVIAAMQEDLRYPHTLSSLAAKVELCPRQLERRFKLEKRPSPLHYLHNLRLAKACDLLVTSFKNVTEIAEAVGFDDVNYFIRVFKARFGCTPLAFRKRSAGEVGAKKIA